MGKYDLIVVGMGPSSIFLAYELVIKNKAKNVVLIDEGKPVEKRYCPVEKKGECMKCKPFCNITSGFSGAGAFSDGKLSLYNKEDEDIYVGGNLHKYIGVEKTKELIDYADNVYLKFGADKHLEGTEYKEEVTKLKKRAKKEDIDLIGIPIRHLGTEKSHEIYKKIQDFLEENGIIMKYETVVDDLIIEDGKVTGVKVYSANNKEEKEDLFAKRVVLAVGRKGADWLSNICEKYNIKTEPGAVDIGVRYELKDEVMKEVNKYLYEGKFIGRPYPFRDKVRTFCQNPSGFVSEEVYDDNLSLVNGHSYKDKKSTNTNLAILVSHNFKTPFNKPIEYGKNVAKNLNELGNGAILVQRLGDIRRGKRTWQEELDNNDVVPTLKSAVPGDITFAIGYRTMTDILRFIDAMDKVVEGFADPHNLLYAPEIKFYSNKVFIDENFETNIKNLYCIGDGRWYDKRTYDGISSWSTNGKKFSRIRKRGGKIK